MFAKIKEIVNQEGMTGLIHRGITFPARRNWLGMRYEERYYYEHTMKERDPAEFLPKIRDFSLHIIRTNQEADELEAKGYEFRSYQTKAHRSLDIGGVAFCIFVQSELAHIGWVALTEAARELTRLGEITAGMVQDGIVKSKGGKVCLLKPSELPENWDPAKDSRLTAWDMVHHLVRALEAGGEGAAAALVSKMGSRAEVARELAYRLYTLCERKKRAAEALSYNGLVQSWPEITRLAREGGKPLKAQTGLFGEEERE